MGFEIPIDVDYPDHPKTRALVHRLKDRFADIYPLRLWFWAAKFSRSGLIKGGCKQLETVCGWKGSPGVLGKVMRSIGFIEKERWVIHDWREGIGRSLLTYDVKKFNQRKAYAAKSGIPFNENPPSLENLPDETGSLPEGTGRIPLSHPARSIQSNPNPPSPSGGGSLPEDNGKHRRRRSKKSRSATDVLNEAAQEGDLRDREKAGS